MRTFRSLRRAARAALAPLSALALVALTARPLTAGGLRIAGALALVSFFAGLSRLRLRAIARKGDRSIPPVDGAASIVAVALAYALVACLPAQGALRTTLSLVPLLVLAAVSSLSAPRAGVITAGFAAFSELLAHLSTPGADVRVLGLRVALLGAAAALHHGLTRTEIARVRAHASQLLEDERARQRDAAKSFRLIAAPSPAPHAPAGDANGDDARRLRSSLDEIRETLVSLLELLRRSHALRTCAVFWLDPRGQALRLVEALTDDDVELTDAPIAAGAGAVGGAFAMGRPIVLSRLRADYGGLGYYRGPHGVKSFAAIPITEGTSVRGVLVADRADDVPFSEAEQESLATAAVLVLRHVRNERVFGMLEKSKDELAKLFNASRALGEALTEDQVIRAVIESARAVVEHDVAVLATFDEATRDHRVRMVTGEGGEKLHAGAVFADNAGIASAAAKTRHALPYRGHFDGRTQYVFSRAASLEGHESVLCLPLVVRDHVVGTLTLAAKRRGAFPDATRQLLGVLAGHAAVAMSNAAAVRRLEEMATTDPMTGLLNKRALESEFERRIRAAARFGRSLAVLVTDIDKFKSVNDTYGHSVGDQVIKGLGAVLAKVKRNTDAVARFGGEEFVLVCEETDQEGAYLLAERIRTELMNTTFATENGPLRVTCSLGVAEFPRDGDTKETLFQRADEALYEAKRGGRNQTRVAGRRAPKVSAATSSRGARESAGHGAAPRAKIA